jgi:hypothetical protein
VILATIQFRRIPVATAKIDVDFEERLAGIAALHLFDPEQNSASDSIGSTASAKVEFLSALALASGTASRES